MAPGLPLLTDTEVLDLINDSGLTYWFDVLPAMVSEWTLLFAYLALLMRLSMPSTVGLDGMSVQCLVTYAVVHFARMWFSRFLAYLLARIPFDRPSLTPVNNVEVVDDARALAGRLQPQPRVHPMLRTPPLQVRTYRGDPPCVWRLTVTCRRSRLSQPAQPPFGDQFAQRFLGTAAGHRHRWR
jgi:hypothetical protein